jgi:tRNA(fMet)-specific endonuclease VapC
VLYILDTDHISLLQRNHPLVLSKLRAIPIENRAVTVISVSEQVQGRLAVISQARTELAAARGFERLQETISFFHAVNVILYDAETTKIFERLRKQGVRIGTQDLRIASIAIHRDAMLVTRNTRDFRQVPDLQLTDWSHNA